jgi:hypothetical protein
MQGACSSDYLNTVPTDSTGSATLFENTENAKFAVNGLAKLMSMQYLSTQGFNGEGTIKMYYGNYPGAHFSVNLPGWAAIINQDYNLNLTASYCYYPWYYYYRIIGNANSIIAKIDGVSGPENEKKYIKAQALTYRAYSYMMLTQLYCLRWSDSNQGASLGLVLREDESDGDMARSTLEETYLFIYKDLDEAIALFDESGIHKNTTDLGKTYLVDKETAYATYARTALNRCDYGKADAMAKLARAPYPLMNVSDYKAGFFNPTSEWIWGIWGSSDETLYFYSYHAYIAYNSTASAVKSYPKCISKELFDKVPDTDVRKKLFLNPADYPMFTYNNQTGQVNNAWRDSIRGTKGTDPTANIYAYMQFKIAASAMPGVGHLNNFRSSEMYLIEAEAQYFLNNPGAAQQALIALNKDSGRDPAYSCTKTGAALFDEIKVYRGLELWGEGFDWFDLKRWGDPLARKSFANGGSFISALAVSYGPEEKNKWTWYIPARELDYNKLAKQNN